MTFKYKNYLYIYENSKLQCSVVNEKNEVIKTMDFAIGGCFDFIFSAMNFSDDSNILIFEVDQNNPIYYPLLKLINNKILLIDDDLTREEYKKYLLIEQKNNNIYISFNKNQTDNSFIFNVTVINIAFDLRSKIDQQSLDTKIRLKSFFDNLNNTFKNLNDKSYEKVKQWKK